MAIPADLELSKRLERAEGIACAQFAEARSKLFPDSESTWIELGGTIAVYDGADSPLTQSFGLGLNSQVSSSTLDQIEDFFLGRKASVMHELSPLAGIQLMEMLCNRNYKPIESSNVLYHEMDLQELINPEIEVRAVGKDEMQLWTDTNLRAWTHEHPELREFFQNLGLISTARKNCFCFLAEYNGQAAAAAALCINDGIALFAGAATIPEYRGRGLQGALLKRRLSWAKEQNCDLAAVVTEPGSLSQRNAQRNGFQIAYTRTKWCLSRYRR